MNCFRSANYSHNNEEIGPLRVLPTRYGYFKPGLLYCWWVLAIVFYLRKIPLLKVCCSDAKLFLGYVAQN
jgi:hypothetical protein